jgi:RNA ligase (TIGR02306 family)
MEIKRKLASVQVIADIQPIEGADAIEVALIHAWKIVIKKGEYAVGQKVVYCEIDSFLPIAPQLPKVDIKITKS